MVVRSTAAPPTPWSKSLAEPTIHETAYIHSFSNLIGDVTIGANVLIAPGTSIRADEGSPFYIGESTNIQDGVVIHGLEQGRIVGDNQDSYSVWVGKNCSLAHMALIHGPAYVGDDCFIGFRSTVFNARVGEGCIVMMHALIQDVEIPPGKYIASGSIITNQQQADRLPDVLAEDVKFAGHVVGINEALRTGYHCAEDVACIMPIRDEVGESNGDVNNNNTITNTSMTSNTQVKSDLFSQVQSLLSQGYRISAEYADERRFKTSSWKSAASIQSTKAAEVVATLESVLTEHSGEYVRLIGIDPKAKRRVLEQIIQRPDGAVVQISNAPIKSNSSGSGNGHSHSHAHAQPTSSGLSSEVVDQIRSLLSQGHRIGLEYADQRRFRTNSWQSGAPIQSDRESEVLNALRAALAEHPGEYVRLIGIDTKAKRRVLEQIIQRADGQASPATAPAKTNYTPSSNGGSSNSNSTPQTSTSLNETVVSQVRSLLAQGYKIGSEHATARRFKTSSWETCSPIQSTRESEVLNALEGCMKEHSGEYVRMIGIDTKAKRRVLETIIQKP